EKNCQSLAGICEKLQAENAGLTRDLNETKTGRKLVELRAELTEIKKRRHLLEVELQQAVEELGKCDAARREGEELLQNTRRQLEETARLAEATSESRI